MYYIASVLLILGSAALMASPYYLLAPVLILSAFALSWLYKQPALGLFAVIFMVPLEIFREILPDYQFLTLSKIVGVALVVVMAVRLALHVEASEKLRSPLWVPILCLLAIYLVSTLASSSFVISLDSFRQLLTAVSIFGLGLLLADRYGYRALIHIIVISVSLPAGAVFFSDAAVRSDARATGLLTDPNFFCLLIVVALPLVLYLVKTAHSLMARTLWSGLLVLHLAAFMQTYSRAGLLVLAFIFLIAVKDYVTQIRPRHFGFVLLFIVLLISAAVMLVPQAYVQRIESLGAFSTDLSSSGDRSLGRRASYLIVGWGMVKQDPLLGAGPGTFPEHYAQTPFASALTYSSDYDEYFREAHNTYLQILCETGVPGFLVFGSLVLLGLRNFYRARRTFKARGDIDEYELSTHLGLAYLGLIVFLMFLSSPDHKYLWFLLAISDLLMRKARAERAEELAVTYPQLAG